MGAGAARPGYVADTSSQVDEVLVEHVRCLSRANGTLEVVPREPVEPREIDLLGDTLETAAIWTRRALTADCVVVQDTFEASPGCVKFRVSLAPHYAVSSVQDRSFALRRLARDLQLRGVLDVLASAPDAEQALPPQLIAISGTAVASDSEAVRAAFPIPWLPGRLLALHSLSLSVAGCEVHWPSGRGPPRLRLPLFPAGLLTPDTHLRAVDAEAGVTPAVSREGLLIVPRRGSAVVRVYGPEGAELLPPWPVHELGLSRYTSTAAIPACEAPSAPRSLSKSAAGTRWTPLLLADDSFRGHTLVNFNLRSKATFACNEAAQDSEAAEKIG